MSTKDGVDSSSSDPGEKAPEASREAARAEAAADAFRVTESPIRCPFCHDRIDAVDESCVVCASCLARQHRECWSELARCGTCSGREILERRKSSGSRVRMAA